MCPLVACRGRSVDQTQPRYRLPSAFANSEVLFNTHRASPGPEDFAVVVVERLELAVEWKA
jgi:hypothetical protein